MVKEAFEMPLEPRLPIISMVLVVEVVFQVTCGWRLDHRKQAKAIGFGPGDQ